MNEYVISRLNSAADGWSLRPLLHGKKTLSKRTLLLPKTSAWGGFETIHGSGELFDYIIWQNAACSLDDHLYQVCKSNHGMCRSVVMRWLRWLIYLSLTYGSEYARTTRALVWCKSNKSPPAMVHTYGVHFFKIIELGQARQPHAHNCVIILFVSGL